MPRPPDDDGYADLVAAEIAAAERSTLTRVINATGVILHTNLGRAPLAPEAVRAMSAAARYGNIEVDLEMGKRGSRYLHCADLVRELVFSGDKLLGGPQAGVMAGTTRAVGLARSHPLCRALRCDKVTLSGLAATLRLHRVPERAKKRIPALRMISTPVEELERRAERIVATAARQGTEAGLPPLAAGVGRGHALVGGGTFPEARIPSVAIVLEAGEEVLGVLARLRSHDPPVVARGRRGRVFLDLRAVEPGDDMVLASALAGLPLPT